MVNKSILLLFLFLTTISCKKAYNPEEADLKNIKSADSLVRLGYDKYNSKDFQGAMDLGMQALAFKGGYPRANVLIGEIHKEVGNYSTAVTSFTNAIENTPDNMKNGEFFDIYLKRATAKEVLKDYRGALADYNLLLESLSSGYVYYRRGILKYDYLDDSNGACSDWSIAGEKGESRAYDLIDKFCNN